MILELLVGLSCYARSAVLIYIDPDICAVGYTYFYCVLEVLSDFTLNLTDPC